MLLFYRDPMEQAIRKRQLQCHSRFPFLLMELSLSQRPFQEVISGSSVPSSGPNGEGRAPEFIDYPHPPRSRVTDDIRLSPVARIAAADLAARSRPSPIQRQSLKGNTPRFVA